MPIQNLRAQKAASESLWAIAIWALMIFFIVNFMAMTATVVVNSFGTRWFGTWLPAGYTTRWYVSAWREFQLDDVLIVTFQIVGAVVLLSGLLGVPAAYALARRNFPGKQFVVVLFLLPMLIPPITLAFRSQQCFISRISAAICPASFLPIWCQRSRSSSSSSFRSSSRSIRALKPRRVCLGAGTGRLFFHILIPLLAPGILAALLLVLVRTIAMFELTFFTAGPGSQTLVVALYYAVYAAGVRASQSIDAMAVVYMLTTLVWLLIALRFVDPTQIVTRAKSKSVG